MEDFCAQEGVATNYIDPGAPWQNGWIESFNARFRDEVLGLRDLLQCSGGEGDRRGLASDLQPPAPALGPRDAGAGGVCGELEGDA